MSTMRFHLAPVCAVLCSAVAVFAQNSNGRISGTITDTSGAVVPGASVTVTNRDTRLNWKAVTDNGGYYLVTSLPVGTYEVEVEATGMRRARQTGYDLPDAGSVTADFKLEVGAVTETATVAGVPPRTKTTRSTNMHPPLPSHTAPASDS